MMNAELTVRSSEAVKTNSFSIPHSAFRIMATKRLIRFSSGPLAGEFRFVAERSGCVQGPSTADDTITAGETTEPTQPSSPTEAAGTTSLTCAEKQAAADDAAAKRAAGFTMPSPTFTPEDAERVREFKRTHRDPNDPAHNIALIGSDIVKATGGLLFGALGQDFVEGMLWGTVPEPPFKTMLEVFK